MVTKKKNPNLENVLAFFLDYEKLYLLKWKKQMIRQGEYHRFIYNTSTRRNKN